MVEVSDGTGTASRSVQNCTPTAPPNNPPAANAGLDQLGIVDAGNNGELVQLDGSASSDPDGFIASFEWFEGGVLIATGATPQVVLAVGNHVIELVVTDDQGATGNDFVTVEILPDGPPPNQAPTAVAGPDQQVTDADNTGFETVALDGSGSSDPDGTIVNFEWREGATILATTVTSSVSLAVGTHTITLTVIDDQGATGSDTVVVTVDPPPPPPPPSSAGTPSFALFVRLAGTGQDRPFQGRTIGASPNSPVFFVFDWNDGTSTRNPDTGFWTTDGTGRAVSNTVHHTWTTLGIFTVTLTVFDGSGTNSAAVTTDVEVVVNQTPVADAGPDQTVRVFGTDTGRFVTVDGSGSFDPDGPALGDILNFIWTEGATTLSTNASFSRFFAIGTHLIDLEVRDGLGGSATDQTVVTVLGPNDPGPPVASATASAAFITELDEVTLDGSGSFDPDGGLLTFLWEQVGLETTGVPVTLTGANTAIATFTAPSVLNNVELRFRLTVTDNELQSDSLELPLDLSPFVVAQSQVIGEVDKVWDPTQAGAGASRRLGDTLGIDLAIDGSWMVVGSPGPFDSERPRPGQAFFYESVGGSWVERAVIGSTQPADFNAFGFTVDLAGDLAVVGERLGDAPGVPDAGVVTVLRRDAAGAWNQEARLTASNGSNLGFFGLALATDGSRIMAGAPKNQGVIPVDQTGDAYIYAQDVGGNWFEEARLFGSLHEDGDNFGTAVDVDGNVAVVGAKFDENDFGDQKGAVYVFEFDGFGWVETARLLPSNPGASFFGESVAVDGDTIVVGATGDDGAGNPYCGPFLCNAVYVFQRMLDGSWIEVQKIERPDPSNAGFGHAVDVEQADILIGARFEEGFGPKAGAAYLYRFNGVGWGEIAKYLPSDARFEDATGFAVSLSGAHAAVGAPQQDPFFPCCGGFPLENDEGAAYVFSTVVEPLLTVHVVGEGNAGVVSDLPGIDCGADCSEVYPLDTVVTLTPQPGLGTSFVAFTGDPDCADGVVTLDATKSCSAVFRFTNPNNIPPVANAGPDQTVVDADADGVELVQLDGLASFDPDPGGSIISYEWDEGLVPIASGPTPLVSLPVGEHVLRLVVTDNEGLSDAFDSTDQVIIFVLAEPPPPNRPPVADAGPDQNVVDLDGDGVETALLDASASFDPDGAASELSYEWSEGGVVLSTSRLVSWPFAVGTHTVTLVVTDADGDTGTDTLIVTVTAGGPVISLSREVVPFPINVRKGDEFTLEITVANAGNQAASGMTMRFDTAPPGSVRLENPRSNTQNVQVPAGQSRVVSWLFRIDQDGPFTATLTATVLDSFGAFVADIVTGIPVLAP
ncbi:MAG: PKD domain-containing protein [Acidimicrobiia bacterium]